MNLKQLVGLLRRWWWLILVVTILGGASGYGISIYLERNSTPIYEAATTLVLNASPEQLPDVQDVSSGSRLVETYSALLLKRTVLEETVDRLDLSLTPDQLLNNAYVVQQGKTNLIELRVRDTDAVRAADIANAIATIFIEENRAQQLSTYIESRETVQAELDAIQEQIGGLNAEIEQLTISIAEGQSELATIDRELQDIEVRLEEIPDEILLKQTTLEALEEIPPWYQTSNQIIEMRVVAQEIESLDNELVRLEGRLPELEAQAIETRAQVNADIAQRGQLQVLVEQARSRYETLLATYEQVRLAETAASEFMSVVNPAQPGRSINDTSSSIIWIVQGLILGLSLAVGGVVLIDQLNDTMSSSEDLERITSLPTLGTIGQIETSGSPEEVIVTARHPRAPISEAYRVLRANLDFASPNGPIRTLVVTSSQPVEGKTTTAANLSVSMAQAGNRVIVVDADLRRPTLHRVFQSSNRKGVTTALLTGDVMGNLVQSPLVPNLLILPSGPLPPNPADLFQLSQMHRLIEELKDIAHIVVFDSPPVLPVADSALLSRMCDGVVLVVLAEKTRTDMLKKAREQLAQAGAPLLGTIMNRVTDSRDNYYADYSGYYYASDDV